MATRQYASLVCEGFKLFKGYFENVNGLSTTFVDQIISVEDWRENCWDKRYPGQYGKKSLPYVGLLFGIDPSRVITIDDKPQIWTDVKQVIKALPYNGGVYLKQNNNTNDNNPNNVSNNDDNANDDNNDKSDDSSSTDDITNTDNKKKGHKGKYTKTNIYYFQRQRST